MDTTTTTSENTVDLDIRDTKALTRNQVRALLKQAVENVPSYVQVRADKFKSQTLEQWVSEEDV